MTEPATVAANDEPAPWWARWLADEWKDSWKWLSSWLIAINAAAPQLYEQVGMVKALLSPAAFHGLQSVLATLVWFALVKRKPE